VRRPTRRRWPVTRPGTWPSSPFKYGTTKSGTIAITVTAIEKGANADLAKYGDKAPQA
jgi:hypothetical protein